jgi:F0F1-type ATP synthase assembly protein I
VPTPASGHHDAQWYRRVATKASAEDGVLPEGRTSDDAAWASVSHLAAGILVYGGLGWLVGRWLGHPGPFAAAGVLLGVGLALFMLFRRLEHTPGPETQRTGPAGPGRRTEDVDAMPEQSGTTAKETRP